MLIKYLAIFFYCCQTFCFAVKTATFNTGLLSTSPDIRECEILNRVYEHYFVGFRTVIKLIPSARTLKRYCNNEETIIPVETISSLK